VALPTASLGTSHQVLVICNQRRLHYKFRPRAFRQSDDTFSNSGNIVTLGVVSKCWHHTLVSAHCDALVRFVGDQLVPHRATFKPSRWKIVVKVDNLRVDRDQNLHDCFVLIESFVASELSEATPQGIDVEIHERAGDPIRYIQMTKNSAFQAHITLRNFNCENSVTFTEPHTFDDAMFTDSWEMDTFTIKDSVYLQESLYNATVRKPLLKHLIVENIRMRKIYWRRLLHRARRLDRIPPRM
jgi:hypothetical protein